MNFFCDSMFTIGLGFPMPLSVLFVSPVLIFALALFGTVAVALSS